MNLSDVFGRMLLSAPRSLIFKLRDSNSSRGFLGLLRGSLVFPDENNSGFFSADIEICGSGEVTFRFPCRWEPCGMNSSQSSGVSSVEITD